MNLNELYTRREDLEQEMSRLARCIKVQAAAVGGRYQLPLLEDTYNAASNRLAAVNARIEELEAK